MACVITNNPKILSICPSATWIDGGPLAVLMECRRRVQEGYALSCHPIMGDIRLLRSPFRTVLLEEKRAEVDVTSLTWVEESTERIRLSFQGCKGIKELEDYQTLDLELFRTASGEKKP
jgi:hypothetical protein